MKQTWLTRVGIDSNVRCVTLLVLMYLFQNKNILYKIFYQNISSDNEIDEQVASCTRMLSSQCYECSECGKQATQRTDLKKHIEAAHLSLYLPCDVCGVAFKTRHHRQNHMRKLHGITFK